MNPLLFVLIVLGAGLVSFLGGVGLAHHADEGELAAIRAQGRAAQDKRDTTHSLLSAQLEERTAQLDAAHIELRACDEKLAEATAKNASHARIPAPRRPRVPPSVVKPESDGGQ